MTITWEGRNRYFEYDSPRSWLYEGTKLAVGVGIEWSLPRDYFVDKWPDDIKFKCGKTILIISRLRGANGKWRGLLADPKSEGD